MHQHAANLTEIDPSQSLLDNLSDTLLNAFSKLKKPDQRFLEAKDKIDLFEEGVQSADRLWTKVQCRTEGDLSRYTTMVC
jgi:sorting nexin-4